jgi:glutamate racemase
MTVDSHAALTVASPSIGVFDSGVGGLSVLDALRRKLPNARFHYLSDNLNFPYGTRAEDDVVACVMRACGRFIDKCSLDILVVACNTASTVALPHLRSRFAVPVVGVVPAIKPAAVLTKTGTIALLATPGTVRRPYTDDLIAQFAAHVRVIKSGSSALVALAEQKLRDEPLDTALITAEVQRMFDESPKEESARLDVVVLGCTHFPLLVAELKAVAPWPVRWIDSSEAIAARTAYLAAERGLMKTHDAPMAPLPTAFFTKMDAGVGALAPALEKMGFGGVEAL